MKADVKKDKLDLKNLTIHKKDDAFQYEIIFLETSSTIFTETSGSIFPWNDPIYSETSRFYIFYEEDETSEKSSLYLYKFKV